MHKPPTIILAVLICCACSDSSPPPEADGTDEAEGSKTGYEQSLDSARDVEDQVLEAAEKQKKAIDEQTGDG